MANNPQHVKDLAEAIAALLDIPPDDREPRPQSSKPRQSQPSPKQQQARKAAVDRAEQRAKARAEERKQARKQARRDRLAARKAETERLRREAIVGLRGK